jgi:Putative restriction endonuclease
MRSTVDDPISNTISSGMAAPALRLADDLPDIDDHIVEPETPFEMYDGKVVRVLPAKPPHGERHAQISALVETHAGSEFQVALDTLIRTSRVDNFAPDVSVYPEAPDPRTGGRQLDQLAFEVVSKQRLAHSTRKARKLTGRGVRRVFAIVVKQSKALEWSTARGTWRPLDPDGVIDDPALAVPLPVAALVHAAKTDDAIARALLAKRNPVLQAVRARDRARSQARGEVKGKVKGKVEVLLAVLAERDLALDARRRARVLAERDPARLERWVVRAIRARTVAEVLAGD